MVSPEASPSRSRVPLKTFPSPASVTVLIALLVAAAIPFAVIVPDGPTGLIHSTPLRLVHGLLALLVVLGLVIHRPAPQNVWIKRSRLAVAGGTVLAVIAFFGVAPSVGDAARMGGPAAANFAAILVAPLGVAGLVGLARMREDGTRVVRIAVDGAVIASSTVVIGWYVVVRPLQDAALAVDLSSTAAMGFLVLDAMAFTLGLLVLSRAAYEGRVIVAVGVVGLALLLFSDVARILQFMPDQPPSSTLSEIGWTVALGCFALAAWMSPDSSGPRSTRPATSVVWPWWLSLPYTFLVPVAVVLVLAAVRDDIDAPMVIGAAAIILILGFRHVIALRDNDELTGRLKASVLQLAHRAEHDELTGLLNRGGLITRLERMRRPSHRFYGKPVTLLFIDIDRFKGVNDTLGHAVGDDVLRTIGSRLATMVEGWGASAVRFAGDEFVLLFPDLGSEAVALEYAQQALDLVEQPISLEGRGAIVVTASAGVSVSEQLGVGETIVREADLAMFEAKSSGRARVMLFEETLRQRGRERMQIEQELRRSLATPEQFEVHLQPLVLLEGQRLWGAEALVRWRHPQRGMLLPGRFLGVAEESGMIVQIGEAVLREACAAAAATPGLVVSVNLSPRQLHDPGLVRLVASQLEAQRLLPGRLCLEVTEGALVDRRAIAVLDELQSLGVRISIDDFGVGASSFRQLRRLPGAQVKIDRSFVERVDMASGIDDRVMIKAMVSLAQQLGLQVVAEGIERETQMHIVRELGVTVGQGWYLGAPQRAAAFVTTQGGRPLVRQHPPAG